MFPVDVIMFRKWEERLHLKFKATKTKEIIGLDKSGFTVKIE